MARLPATTLLWLLFASLAGAAPPTRPAIVDEATTPPQIVTVKSIDVGAGELILATVTITQVPETRERVEINNGVERKITVLVYQNVVVEKHQRFSLVKGRVVRASGDEIPDRDLAKVLKPGTLAVVSSDFVNGHIGQAHAKLFQPETILLLGTLAAADEPAVRAPAVPR